jgi:uncharacterized damage-inducible protein DinB
MSVRTAFQVILLAGLISAGAQRSAAQSFLDPVKSQWEATRNLVLTMAESIPEDKYDYKPTPEVRTVREQLIHLTQENHMFLSQVAGESSGDLSRFNNLKTRAEVLRALRESYEYGAKILAGLNEQTAMEMISFRNNRVPRFAPILSNISDNQNHYGNLVVYVRLNGMVPPRTASR